MISPPHSKPLLPSKGWFYQFYRAYFYLAIALCFLFFVGTGISIFAPFFWDNIIPESVLKVFPIVIIIGFAYPAFFNPWQRKEAKFPPSPFEGGLPSKEDWAIFWCLAAFLAFITIASSIVWLANL